MRVFRKFLFVTLSQLLRRISGDFPGRWRLERFAVKAVRDIGPLLKPIIVQTRDGFRIWADPGEWVGQYVYVTGRYEEGTVRLMTRLLKPGDCFVDVGANVGYLTLVAARLVGPAGSVIAFEPLPAAHTWLERNVALNEASQVSIRSEAVCDRTATAVLHIGSDHHTSTSSLLPTASSHHCADSTDVVTLAHGEILVSCVRLDDVLTDAARVRLIKIDVEGAEHLVVEGANRTLDRDAPDIIVELNGPAAGDALRRRGYTGLGLDGADLGEVTGQVNALFTRRPLDVHRG